jgi:hypothetical protein
VSDGPWADEVLLISLNQVLSSKCSDDVTMFALGLITRLYSTLPWQLLSRYVLTRLPYTCLFTSAPVGQQHTSALHGDGNEHACLQYCPTHITGRSSMGSLRWWRSAATWQVPATDQLPIAGCPAFAGAGKLPCLKLFGSLQTLHSLRAGLMCVIFLDSCAACCPLFRRTTWTL